MAEHVQVAESGHDHAQASDADHTGDGHSGHDEDGHGHARHSHGVSADADKRYLTGALALIVAFLITEVIVGLIAGSLALISDAGHMLTDAASIVLALIAIRLSAKPAQGRWTYGYKRAEILSAQANVADPVAAGRLVRLRGDPPVDRPARSPGSAGVHHGPDRHRRQRRRGLADLQSQPDQPERRRRFPAHSQRPVRVHRHCDRRAGGVDDRLRPGGRHRRIDRRSVDDQSRLRPGTRVRPDFPRGRPGQP